MVDSKKRYVLVVTMNGSVLHLFELGIHKFDDAAFDHLSKIATSYGKEIYQFEVENLTIGEMLDKIKK